MLHLSLTFSDILTHILMVTLRQRISWPVLHSALFWVHSCI